MVFLLVLFYFFTLTIVTGVWCFVFLLFISMTARGAQYLLYCCLAICLSSFHHISCYCDLMPERSNLREKGFILAYSFRGLSPEGRSNSAYGGGQSMKAGAAQLIIVGKA